MEQDLPTTVVQDPIPGDLNTALEDVTDLLAAAMETEESNAETEAASASAPSAVNEYGTPLAGATCHKLSKNFALSDKILFAALTKKEEAKIFFVPGAKTSKTDDGLEMVEPEVPESPFIAAAKFEAERSRTENNAATFSSSGDPRVNFFFHVLEQTDGKKTVDLLSSSWVKDDLCTLKLVASLRDIKDGKGIRRQYQHCLYWLYQKHPKTLYENLSTLLEFGYWKDALHFLMTLLFDGFIHPYFASDDGIKDAKPKLALSVTRRGFGRGQGRVLQGRIQKKTGPRQCDEEKRLYNQKILDHFKVSENILKVPAREMVALRLRFARERFESDPKYRAFHIRIAQIFAKQLQTDFNELDKLNKATAGDGDEKKTKKPVLNLSLVGKWAPTLEGHFDRYTLIASTIALEFAKLLKKEDILGKSSIPVAVYLARKFYNKSACIPLRTQLEVPERAMSQNEWSNVNYARVPAKCMKLNKEHFIKHDQERFEAYLKRDDAKVAGATLKPMEIITSAMSMNDFGSQVAEAEKILIEKQWFSLAEDIKKKGGVLLSDAIAVCDVSGSMHGDPMAAAIGLTLLTMNMSAPPWNEICITFHESPTMHNCPSHLGLAEKVESLQKMEWGGNTDLQAVFQQIVDLSVKNKLTQAQMPKILLIFTDMEFDAACGNSKETNFEYAKDQFQKHGYTLPNIVFWNLRDAPAKTSTPVRGDERGTVLLSGWSGQLLAFIMSQDMATCNPWGFVSSLVDTKKYDPLKIYD